MKLERLALKGLSSAFPDAIDLPLRDLPPGLIAVTGPNGEGKTILLEATPGALYRQLPARDGRDPVVYATGRDSFIDEEFSIGALGTFRVRLNLDGPKRQSDAVLEQAMGLGPDVTWIPLNDGKRSTFDAAIKDRFPSFDLFINSAFAAQGRGDEFTRRKPSQRKDLFVEFLALQHYAVKAKAATEAAELHADARLRLTAVIEQLESDTAQAFVDALDRQAKDLQVKGGDAQVRERALADAIADLETRANLVADQVAAYAAALGRVQQTERDLAVRRSERTTLDASRRKADADAETETNAITARCKAAYADIANRIAGNEQIREQAADIRSAVAAIAVIDERLPQLREQGRRRQVTVDTLASTLRTAEADVHAFTAPTKDLDRAKTDASLLRTVPCGGAGVYAACQFLTNASAAEARIAELEALVAQMADTVRSRDELSAGLNDATEDARTMRTQIAALEQERKGHEVKAKYEKPLLEAETRIAELQAKRTETETEAARQIAAAQERLRVRSFELDDDQARLDETIRKIEASLGTARQDLAAAAAGNSQAAQLTAELAAARRERDTVIAAIAASENGRQELERRRQELADKRARLTVLQERRQRIERDLLEWRDLAKALGKGGLPDLEIDQAGPTISATTNAILLDCFGPRFSIELVTQVEKADGSGFKDEFTVRVMDNARAGGWRDISDLSGGQKVIVQEALMCAIALYVNERSPMPIKTLWRDETGAALDPENALHYVAMLRKVRELGGFHHVFFISHTPAAAALADAQIQVGGGQARIVYPPFSEAA